MAGSAHAFERGRLNVYQILLIRYAGHSIGYRRDAECRYFEADGALEEIDVDDIPKTRNDRARWVLRWAVILGGGAIIVFVVSTVSGFEPGRRSD